VPSLRELRQNGQVADESDDDDQLPPQVECGVETPKAPQPWGPWATAGFSVLILALHTAIQFIVIVALGKTAGAGLLWKGHAFAASGDALAAAVNISALICGAVVLLSVRLRKGISIRKYLGLQSVPLPVLLLWLFSALVFEWLCMTSYFVLGKPLVSDFVSNAFASTKLMPLLWIACVVVGPLFEELFFRGFLFEGIRHSKLGTLGTILVTSALWALLHALQYEFSDIAWLFVLGLFLGYARHQSGSLVPPIAIHMLLNLIGLAYVTWRSIA